MKKVRYLTVSRMAVEVVSKLSEHEKASFLDILYSAFKQIENGESVTVPAVEGVLSVILDDAIAELETGFSTYKKRMNARNKADQADKADQVEPEPVNNQRSINDPSPIDNRREEKRKEKKRTESEESDGEGNGGNRLPTDKEQLELQAYQLKVWLQNMGIGIDEDILKAWNQYGFDVMRSAVHRFDNSQPPVKKSIFLDIVREEGNRH